MEELRLIQGYQMCLSMMIVDQDHGVLHFLIYLDVANESSMISCSFQSIIASSEIIWQRWCWHWWYYAIVRNTSNKYCVYITEVGKSKSSLLRGHWFSHSLSDAYLIWRPSTANKYINSTKISLQKTTTKTTNWLFHNWNENIKS